MTPHACDITTNTLTTTHHHDDHDGTTRSITRHQYIASNHENEFRGHLELQTKSLFGINHTLTGDISHALIKCLTAAYAHLKETMRNRYSVVLVQTLLRTLVISVCDNTSLCSQIYTTKCLTFDRALHFKYIAATKHIVTQSVHTTFISRDHHSLHIPSLLLTQLQERAREFDVRLNSSDPTQHAPPLARLVAMISQPNHHKNLIRDAIIGLTQYGLHLRDADQPLTSLSLQLFLNHPRSTTQPQPDRLPLQEISRNTLLTPTIRTVINGSILTSYVPLLMLPTTHTPSASIQHRPSPIHRCGEGVKFFAGECL